MANRRVSIRKIREMLRLHYDSDLSQRAIAKSIGVSRSTVGDLFIRFKSTGLGWPLLEGLDDAQLEACMYPGNRHFPHRRPEPDWDEIHRELRNKEVTLHLLWLEYREAHPDGYQYSQFCHRYRTWRGKVDVTMRQRHRAGEKMYVDYAGLTMFVIDPDTGEKQPVQIFVAVLGASNYTYAEACWSQDQESFIGASCRALEFFEGVPEVAVPDNLKSAVRAVDRYEPDINPTYLDWAQHYGIAVIPARPGHPRDKAKVEKSVQVVEQWILAPLRKRRFFRLGELNAAIWDLLFALNRRPFQKMEGSRRSWFESVDRPALRPLPTKRYEYAIYKYAKVNIDYHIEVQRNYYSVPYHLARQSVEVRISAGTVEILHRGRRVASHRRLFRRGQFSTDVAHMPKEHKYWARRTPEWLIRQGEAVGPKTSELLQTVLQKRPHPQQGFRTCMGILRLARSYPDTRMEAAAERALRLGVCSYRSCNPSSPRVWIKSRCSRGRNSPRSPTRMFVEPRTSIRRESEYMITQETVEKLKMMRLSTMAHAFDAQLKDPDYHELSFEERFGLLVDEEWTTRRERRLARLLKEAKFRIDAPAEDIDLRTPRGLDRGLLRSLLTGKWITDGRNASVIGPTGVGKTFLACALGNAACRQGFRTRYYRLPNLLQDLQLAQRDGTLNSLLSQLTRIHLLILDDWGLTPLTGD